MYTTRTRGVDGWGTALQAGRSRVPFPIHSARTTALLSTQPLTEISTTNISCGGKSSLCVGWKHNNFMCRLSWNLGASTSRNPQGLYRPIKGLLYTCSVELLRGAGVLEFIGILFNGRTELKIARGMNVYPCRSGQAKDLWWIDSLIWNILQHVSVGFRKPWLQLDWTVEPKKSGNDKYQLRNNSYDTDTSSSDVAS